MTSPPTREEAPPSQATSFFTTFPGEIRNQIFTLYISHALVYSTPPQLRQSHSNPPPFSPQARGIAVIVHSRRKRPGFLKLEGIRPLPLLLVNKQAYAEVSSLVYALVTSVTIGHNMPQYLDEDPNEWWNHAFSLVDQRPEIRQRAKTVKVILPPIISPVLRTTYASLRATSIKTRNGNKRIVVPKLENFLGAFDSLTNVTLVFVANRKELPNFEELLPMLDRYGDQLTVLFEHGGRPLGNSFYHNWRASWTLFLTEYAERQPCSKFGSGCRISD